MDNRSASDTNFLISLLDSCLPASVLSALPEQPSPAQALIKAEALLGLDCFKEAAAILESLPGCLSPGLRAQHGFLSAQTLLRQGQIDRSILVAQRALKFAADDSARALNYAVRSSAFARKRCWTQAESCLSQALQAAPAHPQVLAAQARLHLEADRRLQARLIYDQMTLLSSVWARVHAGWGLGYVAYLLGEFDLALQHAESALALSPEAIAPLYVLAQVALARQEAAHLDDIVQRLAQRSPQADGLLPLQRELDQLRARQANHNGALRHRLEAFPTLVQRRDYCGPSTVELVLRYWDDQLKLTNDQIARQVMLYPNGTPLYRMVEFFNLYGFDTLRARLPLERLKALIQAGFPVILQQEHANSSHVVVAIGYDDAAQVIELQDPMTHIVATQPFTTLQAMRQTYCDAALVAFPRGRGLENQLAHLGVFNHPAILATDQAVQKLDSAEPIAAAHLLQQAVELLPEHALAWILLLQVRLDAWQQVSIRSPQRIKNPSSLEKSRRRFMRTLAKARRLFPQAGFIHQFQGRADLQEQKVEPALRAFELACQADPEDARNHASLAECHFYLRHQPAALIAAQRCLELDPASPDANIWMARSLLEADPESAYHYAVCALELGPQLALSHLAWGEAALLQGDIENAQRALQELQRLSPDSFETVLFASKLALQQEDFKTARRELHRLLRSQNPLPPAIRCAALQSLIRLHTSLEEYPAALEVLQNLLLEFPTDFWAIQHRPILFASLLLQSEPPVPGDSLDLWFDYASQAISASQAALPVVARCLADMEALVSPESGLRFIASICDSYPQQPALQFLHAGRLDALGYLADAAQAVEKALLSPQIFQNPDHLIAGLEILLRARGFQAVEAVLDHLFSSHDTQTQVWVRRALGLALATMGQDSHQAARFLQEALAWDSQDVDVMLALGDLAQSDTDREQLYRLCLLSQPDWHPARLKLAEFLLTKKRFTETLELTTPYASAEEYWLLHAQALMAAGMYEQAARQYACHLSHRKHPESDWLQGEWLAEMKSGWLSLAHKTARRAMRLFRSDPLWCARLVITLRQMDELEEAAHYLERARQLGLLPKDEYRLEYELAIAGGDLETALAWIDQLHAQNELDSSHQITAWLREQRVDLLLQLNRITEAHQFLSAANPDASAWGQAAWLAFDRGLIQVASQWAEQALQAEPQNYAGLYTRAQTLEALGENTHAIEIYQRLCTIQPYEHNAYEKLALQYALQNDLEAAFELAEKAVALGAFCPQAWAVRGLVQFLRGQNQASLSDLHTAWNRSDAAGRMKMPEYWLVFSLLNQDQAAAQAWRLQVVRRAEQQPSSSSQLALLRLILARSDSLLH